jgi:hypothetical protein
MHKTLKTLAIASLALPFAVACATDGTNGPSAKAGTGTATAANTSAPTSGGSAGTTGASTGTSTSTGAGATTGAATGTGTNAAATGAQSGATASTTRPSTGIPALVNVNLQNVLNDLSVRLQIDRANVPVNIQLPIELAANVCGVSVNVLAVSGGGQGKCTAKTAPQELAQVVQQQMAAGGSVGGGAQGGSTASTGGAPTSGAATGGAGNTSATSSGTTETTTKPR